MASVVLFALFLEAACYLALRLPVLQDVASRNWLKYYRDSGLYEDIDQKLFYNEQRRSNTVMDFDYYLYYRPTGRFSGRYVSTDENGFRTTVQYFKSGNLRKKVIVFFGASTMWGAGTAGDDATIPSLFAKYINAADPLVNYEVKNYGVGGYQSTQEMLLLMEKLGREQIDYAVFFDWTSDTLMGYREMLDGQRKSGFLQPCVNAGYNPMVKFLVERGVFNTTIKLGLGLRGLLDKSSTLRLVSRLAENFKARFSGKISSGYTLSAQDNLQAERIVALYKKDKAIIEALAAKFHFQPFFIMHSNIYTKERLSAYEKKSSFWSDTHFVRFQDKVYALARAQFLADKDFSDISRCMDTAETVFVDDHHMTRRGNDLNARALMDKIGKHIIASKRE
jgi:lysophospholipase L1-like esterase